MKAALLFLLLAASYAVAENPTWAELFDRKGVEVLVETPEAFRGKYQLLQVSKNDGAWIDVSAKNIHCMTINAGSAVEHLRGESRAFKRVATTKTDSGTQVVALVLADNTTLIINLIDAAKGLATIHGDGKDPDGSEYQIAMRCQLTK